MHWEQMVKILSRNAIFLVFKYNSLQQTSTAKLPPAKFQKNLNRSELRVNEIKITVENAFN